MAIFILSLCSQPCALTMWVNIKKPFGNQALDYAEQAIEIDPKMPQPLATAAICCALLDERDDYEHYYRQAVSAGYDGQKIKNAIRSLDPAL